MLCALLLCMSGKTYSLTSTSNDRFLRKFFMTGLFTLRVFARTLPRGSPEEILFHISHNYSLFCSHEDLQTTTVFFTRNFTQDWLNSYWLSSNLAGLFIVQHNQSNERSWIRTFMFLPFHELYCDHLLFVYSYTCLSLSICVVWILFTLSLIVFSLSTSFILMVFVFVPFAYCFHVKWKWNVSGEAEISLAHISLKMKTTQPLRSMESQIAPWYPIFLKPLFIVLMWTIFDFNMTMQLATHHATVDLLCQIFDDRLVSRNGWWSRRSLVGSVLDY